MAGVRHPVMEVQENIRVIRLYIISEAHRKTKEYFTLLKNYYYEYLLEYKTQYENHELVDVPGVTVTDETFNKAETEYKQLEKTLMKINKHIDKDFEYAVEIGKDVITHFQKIISTQQDIENIQLQPESMERNKKLRKLHKKYQKAIEKCDKSASQFNQCVIEYQALADNLRENVISIPSWTSRTKYSISLAQLENWFKRLTETDELTTLRDNIKRTIAANQPAQPPLDTSRLNLTPIQIITMPTPA